MVGGVLWRELRDRQTAPSARGSVLSLRCTVPDRLSRETGVNATKNARGVRKVVDVI